jgi:phosphoglycolate phosphatase
MIHHSSFMTAPLRLVIFDLDGTLVDSHQDIAEAANALVAELGGRPLSEEAITAMVGEGAAVLVGRALAAAGLDPATPGALDGFLRLYDERLLRHTRPYEGMVDVVRTLHATRRVSVLTNKPSRATVAILRGLGFEPSLNGIIGGDTPVGRKPDPAGLRALMAAAGARPDETLLVGDSPIDFETARQGGVAICLARYGFGYRFERAEFRGDEFFIDAPRDLLAVIATIETRMAGGPPRSSSSHPA